MKFKLNQKIYCKYYKKYGKIIDIHFDGYFPIIVRFDDGDFDSYTADGKLYNSFYISLTFPIQDKINKLLSI